MSSQHGAAKRLRKELMLLERSEATSLAAAATARKKNNRVASSSTWSFNTAEQQQHGSSEELDDDVYLRPASCDSILRWKGLLRGPPDSPYSGGIFQLNIRCGTDYPLAPPNISFDTKVFHPNVHFRTGDVCLDILKKEWSPAWGLQAACRAVLALLSDPDADSPLNCDAGNMIRGGDMLAFNTVARMYTQENARWIEWPKLGQRYEF